MSWGFVFKKNKIRRTIGTKSTITVFSVIFVSLAIWSGDYTIKVKGVDGVSGGTRGALNGAFGVVQVHTMRRERPALEGVVE